jgi:hypothetical protein
VDSLRVRWVLCSPTTLCTPYFQRLGAFAKGNIPRVDGVTVRRLLRPIRHFPRSSEFHPGSPPSYCPLSFAFLRKLPVFSVEDSSRMMKVACFWRPHPLSAAPQSTYRVGQVYLYCMAMQTLLSPLLWPRSNHFGLDWLASQTRYARVSFPRRAIHASRDSPCHSSAKHHLLGACLPLMAPFRSMLLTS